jgi:hypothetical protein
LFRSIRAEDAVSKHIIIGQACSFIIEKEYLQQYVAG